MPPSARVCAARRRSLGLPRDRRARSGSPAVLGRLPCRPDDFASPAFAGFALFRIIVCVRYRIASSIADCGEVYRRRARFSHRRQRLIRSEVRARACRSERGGRECLLTRPLKCSCSVADAIKAANRTALLNYSRCVGGATGRVDRASLRTASALATSRRSRRSRGATARLSSVRSIAPRSSLDTSWGVAQLFERRVAGKANAAS